MAGRIWNDATYAVGRGISDAIGLASNGPAPARYTLRAATAIVAAPVAVVGALEAPITASVLTAAGTPQGQRVIRFANDVAWDVVGTGQPGVFELLQRTQRVIENSF